MIEFANYIGGAWLAGDEVTININPSDTGDIVGEYCNASREQVRTAIAAAYAAFGQWSATSPQQRADVLEQVGIELSARREELGELLSREEGKIRAEGVAEVLRASQIFKFYAQEALRLAGDIIQSIRPGVAVEVIREPVGVVGVITPWNFPIAIPAWKIAPALAFGNTVVFKPADLTPALGWHLVEIISRCGAPGGVINLVMGRGSVVGDEISRSNHVAAVTFTGSVATGRTIREMVTSRGGKIQQEMGGKSPLIILDDADLDLAAECAVGGSLLSTGQRCTSNTRIIATPAIHDALVDRMVEKAKALTVGHALDAATKIGPVVDERQLATNMKYVDIARKEGGRVLYGGERLQLACGGYYMSPAVIAGCSNDMQHVREEIFGPVVSILKVDDYEEAVHTANDSDFALSSGICTTSLAYAQDFKRRSKAGLVMVNLPTAGVDYHVPFGGRRGSSYGSREQGRYAAEFFTETKTAYVHAPL